ncbi:MAG: transglutaminase family protein [Pirellulales bacterium]
MAIRVALNHQTSYRYDRLVNLSPHVVRLRPAPHGRTPILSYSLKITPPDHFLNWQQDPQSNYLARLVFNKPTREFKIEVDLVAEMTVINPFDFFLEPDAEQFPFAYDPWLSREIKPYLETEPAGPQLSEWLASVDLTPRRTIDFLVELNQRLHYDIKYLIRLEPGVQSCEETLTKRSGSCRDTGWLLVQILRHLGLAARFVSGYLIQLVPDVKPLDGPAGAAHDFTDLHAWCEVYLPGAGWVGLDPTSGLLAGEGHIPLACTPDPVSAAPVTGAVDDCETEFGFSMTIERLHEDPRVTKPYNDEEWRRIEALGHEVDRRLAAGDVRLTMGGEPTFVSIDDMEGDEWNTTAMGPTKRKLAGNLARRLYQRFAPGGLLHFGQGKWYPGESLPRWALSCFWRRDGKPIWLNPELFARDDLEYGYGSPEAERFSTELAERLGIGSKWLIPAYEDVWYYLWKERRLPTNVDPLKSELKDPEERARLARIFERGLESVVGQVLPIRRVGHGPERRWTSGPWFVRSEHMFLIPGDSPMGLRLPIDSLPWLAPSEYPHIYELDPLEERPPLPEHPQLARQAYLRGAGVARRSGDPRSVFARVGAGGGGRGGPLEPEENGETDIALLEPGRENGRAAGHDGPHGLVRTAMCVEPRDGKLHVFMPPTETLEDYLDLVAIVEETADSQGLPVVVEGYLPPTDHRLNHFKITPDPGVIEVNIQPAHSWDELVKNTTGLYDDARLSRLGTEKFMLDGRHTGTGGGNHVVLGGPKPADSPFLRRPDLLRSLVAFWQNHPSLSYLFSGMFVGPTSQAPRVDEARHDTLYELETAFQQVDRRAQVPPWLVDRLFRNLLIDVTGNTHRAEFCIDKMYSPDSSAGRLGLVEFRAFEMPPHARMSLTQQLLLRSLVSRFWERPYDQKLVHWGSTLHDRFLLPHFVWQDFEDVIDELKQAEFPLEAHWFAPHFEFRFPFIGEMAQRGVHVELRTAMEPWNVLGEEPGGGGTVRYVDSSVERLQVKVSGMTDPRHVLSCNGRRVPLHPTGTAGEYVAGVRYRAWQPPNCLHPNIPVHSPLVIDLVDTWLGRSLGGCTYHVAHPGGRSYDVFPVNSYEAETRRASRFFRFGHTGGPLRVTPEEPLAEFPLTLDLRRTKRTDEHYPTR